MPKRKVILEDWGKISYNDAWERQGQLQRSLIEFKRNNDAAAEIVHHRLVLCEHYPVITLGKSGSVEHLLLNEPELEREGIEFYKINRGGDITYHGPGQIVGYPILDLDDFFTDVHKFVRLIEQAIMNVLAKYNIEAYREKGYTGVWLPATPVLPKRKICAIGIHLSRWVSMHGFAFNINTDLSHFRHIVPCGIQDDDKAVTSLSIELGRKIEMQEIKTLLALEFQRLFDWDWLEDESNSTTFVKEKRYNE